MKTQTEKQLEREIAKVRNTLEDVNLKKLDINEFMKLNSYIDIFIREAKLEGYRKAKEEFNKKVEKLKEEINYIIFANETDIEQGYEGAEVGKHINVQLKIILEKIDKVFGEEKLKQ